ncbi:olfactory receptor 12, partial [Danaus plexippus plexippus]
MDYDRTLYLTSEAFKFSGIEMGYKRIPGYLKYLYHFNALWLYADVFGEFFWLCEGIAMGKSIDLLSRVAPCSALCILSTAKTLPMVTNNDILKDAVLKLRRLHQGVDLRNSFECDELMKTSTILKNIITVLVVGFVCAVVLFTSMPGFLMAYDFFTTGTYQLQLPFFTKYFVDVFADARIYTFVYLHQFVSTVLVGLNIFAADTLFFAFCSYVKMHFRILGHYYENIVGQSESETRNNLRRCVRTHQVLIKLVNQINILYSKSTLVNIMTSSFIICLCGFNITITKSKDMSTYLLFIPFLMNSLTEIFLMCFFGDQMIDSSYNITQAVYSSRWYDAGEDLKRSVLLILF